MSGRLQTIDCINCPEMRGQYSEQIGMGSGVGERKNKFAVGGVKIEKYPVVFDVAVSQSLKIAGERMVLVLRRQGFSHGEGADNCGNLIFVGELDLWRRGDFVYFAK